MFFKHLGVCVEKMTKGMSTCTRSDPSFFVEQKKTRLWPRGPSYQGRRAFRRTYVTEETVGAQKTRGRLYQTRSTQRTI